MKVIALCVAVASTAVAFHVGLNLGLYYGARHGFARGWSERIAAERLIRQATR